MAAPGIGLTRRKAVQHIASWERARRRSGYRGWSCSGLYRFSQDAVGRGTPPPQPRNDDRVVPEAAAIVVQRELSINKKQGTHGQRRLRCTDQPLRCLGFEPPAGSNL
jgi:hypothetical protein